jgi:lipopolysaccharide transport system permease protein
MNRPYRPSYPSSPLFVFGSLWRHRELVWEMTKRDVVGRYRGSAMGILWSFLNPLLMLAVYTFVFSVVFRTRWGDGDVSKTEFALVLFAGMIVHALFAECVNRAPALILGNVNYVKKVVFPLEILPWMAMGSALFHASISVAVLVTALALVHVHLNWTVVLFPIVIVPLVLLTMGVSWFFASLGVFLRDVSQTTGIITTIMLFMSPVFFPASALPEEYRVLLLLNPLTFIIEQARDVLIWGRTLDWRGWAIHVALGLAAAWLGLFWFQKTRKGFADVL